jgi:ribosome-associated translation inhibitor RaiA
MKTSLRYLGLNAQAAWNRLVEEHLNLLQKLTNIESAQVILERQREGTPAFRAHMVLVVPGPDFHVAARDHTLQAVILKVVQRLEEQIVERQRRQLLRLKRREQCRAVASQWSRSA